MTKVHIVYPNDERDIISRMMVCLARGAGWTIENKAKPSADINYFGLYLFALGRDKHLDYKGKTAAWFSHYEIETPHKMEMWQQAAEWVDIRLTSAPQYLEMLKPYGETHLVIPPVHEQFELAGPRSATIGVSGFVYPHGRKGEHLVSQLSEYCKGRGWHIKASGKGWDVEDIQEYDWLDMPDFYRSLDVLLVTSYTEGIPMPPLEALACGTPVVAPYGVGLLDELDSPHIFHYKKGSFEGMIEALKDALYPDRAVRKFSQWNWVHSHKKAFGLT